MKKKIWFKAKLYGWGWYPSTWEGWLCILVYAAVVVYIAVRAEEASPNEWEAFLSIIPSFTLLTAALIFICYKKGEKPRWRWGK